jgi:protein involved in polysaccharide export with SLBB domain
VTVGRDSVAVDGKPVDSPKIGDALRAIPAADRPSTTVEVAAATDDVPVGRFMEVFAACAARAQELGMPPVSNVGVEAKRPVTRPATAPARVSGEYYMYGTVTRPGAYSLNGRDVALTQAIVSAGMPKDGAGYVTVIRREGDREMALAENVVIRDLLAKRVGNVVLRPYDLVRVSAEKLPAYGPGGEVRPAPHAGEAGEVHVGGHVGRPGVYSVSGRKLTAALLVASAGGLDDASSDLVDVWRPDGKDRRLAARVSLRKVLDGAEPDLYLQPGDVVEFRTPPPPEPAGK